VSPSNKDWGEEFMRNYRELCNDVNIELAPNCPNFEKAFERTMYGKVLGKFFDTETLCWSVPDDKKREAIDDIHHVFFNKSNLLTLQSLMGKLNDVAIMCPFMKNFRHELNSEISLRMQDPEKLSHLSYKAKQELNVWEGFLSDENKWIPICPPERPPPIHSFVFTSDAAGLPHASCYKCKIGVASVGEDPDGNLIFASRLWWENSLSARKGTKKVSDLATKVQR
jgi:hypothetical protein